ncbi:MAG: dihydroorotate dehydrogenase electron transfer subunit, partial [Desulfobacterales bacterium]
MKAKEMYQEKVKVLWNRRVGPGYYQIGLTCHPQYKNAKPGQFIMLRFPGQITPFLRRPFSIHQLIYDNDRIVGIEILYKVIGEGTEKLSALQVHDDLDILGPLGNGFTVSSRYKTVYLAAGGIGVAPMVFLASYLKTKGVDTGTSQIFLGGRSKDDLLCRDEFLSIGMKLQVTTDDGSEGDRCFITHPLEIASKDDRPDIIYACGPLEMLKCVVGIAEKYHVPCQVSVETMMACGMGA